jgi:general secretion pathway protein G
MRGRDGGFTLIELLVVMAIVALLLTIAVPRYFGSLRHSREVALKENLKV